MGGRTAKITEIAFALQSSHFRVGQIAEGFEIFNPAFGAHGRGGGGLGKTGSIEERRVKAQTSLVAACYQERAPGTPRLVPSSAQPLSYFSPHLPTTHTAHAILLRKTKHISRYHAALSTLSLHPHSEPTCPKPSHLRSRSPLSLGYPSFPCFLQTDSGIRNCGQ